MTPRRPLLHTEPDDGLHLLVELAALTRATERHLYRSARVCIGAGLTPEEVANALGVSRATLYRRMHEASQD